LGTATTTDANGTAVFQDITYGSYTISVSAYGYYDASMTKVISSNDTINISLAALPKGDVQINVKDGDNGGAPFAGATVQLKDLNGEVVASAVSDSQGKAILSGIVNGLYTVVASYDWRYAPASMDIAVNGNGVYNVTLSKIKTSVTVQLTDNSGIVPQGVSVTGIGPGGTTNAKGEISFSNVHYGQYNVTLTSPYHSSTSTTVTVDTPNQTINISLVRNKVTVTVHVQNSRSGASISGASVTGIGSSKTTDSNGNATFSNIWANSYSIQASASNYNTNSNTFSITGNQTITISLTPIDRITVATFLCDASGSCNLQGYLMWARLETLPHGEGGTVYQVASDFGYATFNNIPIGSYYQYLNYAGNLRAQNTAGRSNDLPVFYGGGIVYWEFYWRP